MRKVVFNETEIQGACERIASELTKELQNEEKIPLFLGVMKGALNFFMDLKNGTVCTLIVFVYELFNGCINIVFALITLILVVALVLKRVIKLIGKHLFVCLFFFYII